MLDGETAACSDELLADLTVQQREAAAHVDGPLLVLAGPGSGKTRVITRRIAHLVLRVGIPPWNVLAITFTNKAAGEMRDRIGQLLSSRQARALNVSTFHSLGARVIRRYADRLGLPSGYSIYDAGDQQRAVKQACKELNVSSANFQPSAVLAAISNAKNALLDPDEFAQSADDFYSRTVAKIYVKYEQMLKRNKALDFDDLLVKMIRLFKANPDVLAELRERFVYILIDEYQDTNHVQFLIANALAAPQKNLCVTGDPDQAIYRWRGADIRNILEFESHYPDAKVVRLEQNYRSTKHILAAADALIRQNSQRKHKDLWTENPTGELPQLVTCRDERHEAAWVVQQFRQLNEEGNPWSGMAVFYRINSLSRVIEDALRTANIPYQIARGTAFYERKEIKDAVAYLRVIANPDDEVNQIRIINTPRRGISKTTVQAAQAHAAANGINLTQVLRQPTSIGSLNTRAIEAVERFNKLVDGWRARTEQLGSPSEVDTEPELFLPDFVERVLRESGLEQYYQLQKNEPDEQRLMNLGELVSSAQQFETDYEPEVDAGPLMLGRKLELFLEQISLVSDVDTVAVEQGAVTLMTLHAAKGLEFPMVAMIGVEEGLLPHSQAVMDPDQIEEERRLCFVGITRAEQRLFLCHTQFRTVFGQTLPAIASRFIEELPSDHILETDESKDSDGHEEAMRSADQQGADEFEPGMLVRHPHFGLGRIISVRSSRSQTRARVEFNTSGVKTLILQYARLEKVSI